MGKRTKNRRPKALVSHMSLRPPYTRDEWLKMKVSDVARSRVFHDYFERCVAEVFRSPRRDTYVTRLVGMTHIDRLTEFEPQSFGKFLHEAGSQQLTTRKLESTLEAILDGVTGVRLNPVEQFEFLAFSGDFAEHTAGLIGVTDHLQELIGQVMTLALMSLILAVNAEFGCGPNDCHR